MDLQHKYTEIANKVIITKIPHVMIENGSVIMQSIYKGNYKLKGVYEKNKIVIYDFYDKKVASISVVKSSMSKDKETISKKSKNNKAISINKNTANEEILGSDRNE